jgi:hypothetical protein
MPAYGATLAPDELSALVDFLGAQRGDPLRQAGQTKRGH